MQPQTKRAILSRIVTGHKVKAICDEFGVSPDLVRSVRNAAKHPPKTAPKCKTAASAFNHNVASDTLARGDLVTFGPHKKKGHFLSCVNGEMLIQLETGEIRRTLRQAVHYTPTEQTILERALAVRKKKYGAEFSENLD